MKGSGSCICASSASSYSFFIISSSSSSSAKLKPHHHPNLFFNSSSNSSSSSSSSPSLRRKCQILTRNALFRPRSSILRTSSVLPIIAEEEVEEVVVLNDKSASNETLSSSSSWTPKIDKSGRFCSPRAARELALLMAYASCLEGSDPVRLFDKRINAPREPGYEFDKNALLEYNHMSFGGPPITTDTLEQADQLLLTDEKESAIEAEVLAAPPKLVYSKLILRFTRKLLVAVVDKWDDHVIVIDKIVPSTWKDEPAGRILELCILHLAMSEITQLGTRHQIVINEAVDLAKRFCDGAAPRIINGCLRTFVKTVEAKATGVAQSLDAKQTLSS